MEFIPNPHKIEHPAGTHMLDNQSRITLWQTEPAALLYAQMLQSCLREYAGLEVPFTRGKPRAGDAVLTVDTALPQNRYTLSIAPECITLKAGSDEHSATVCRHCASILNSTVLYFPRWKLRTGPILLTEAIIRTAPADVSRRWII